MFINTLLIGGVCLYISNTIPKQDTNIIKEEASYTSIVGASRHTYEDYRVFGNLTKQYEIQQNAYTDNMGLRYVIKDNKRYYCVAVGSGTNMTVGDYGYLLYDNDVKLNIIVGDIKADKDTDSNNLITVYSNCASEFIVDVDMLYEEWKYNGDVGIIRNEDNGEVSMVVGIGKY